MSEQEANENQGRAILYPLPLSVARIKGLSSGAKMLFARLVFGARGCNLVRTGAGPLAASLAASKQAIRRWRRALEKSGLIKVERDGKSYGYHLNRKYTNGESIALPAETMERRDVTRLYKLMLCFLLARQDGRGCMWASQKKIARDLGCSEIGGREVLKAMKAKGEVQVRLRGTSRRQCNEYTLTLG